MIMQGPSKGTCILWYGPEGKVESCHMRSAEVILLDRTILPIMSFLWSLGEPEQGVRSC